MPLPPGARVSLIFSFCALFVSTLAWISVLHLRHSVRYSWSCKDQGHCYEARYSEAFDRHVFNALLREAIYERERAAASEKAKVKLYQGEVCHVCGDKKDKGSAS